MNENKRVVFLDYLRVIACFLVMLVHACESFYLGEAGFEMASRESGLWAVLVDSACRASVPLFVMASAYLLFPVTQPAGAFFRRRLVRVLVPYLLFCCAYTFWFGDGGAKWLALLFNFPFRITGGHLWFVPMLVGLYLIMPLLSPWAEKASARDVRALLLVWLFTTTFPFLRKLFACLLAAPGTEIAWAHTFGTADFGEMPFLWGECGWNPFGAFHYASGFLGYMLLGFWFRKFAPALSWRKTLVWAVPLWLVGYAIVAGGFWARLPFDGTWPFVGPWGAARSYPFAVEMETSWEFCSTGVALTVIAYFLVLRKLTAEGAFYRRVIRPLSEASYGTYLVHIFFLSALMPFLKPLVSTPVAIFGCAALVFAASSVFSGLVRKLPAVGKLICG